MARIEEAISIYWDKSYGEFIDLDEKCQCTFLEPEIDGIREPDPTCSECGGVGFVLTEIGMAILDLVERHLSK